MEPPDSRRLAGRIGGIGRRHTGDVPPGPYPSGGHPADLSPEKGALQLALPGCGSGAGPAGRKNGERSAPPPAPQRGRPAGHSVRPPRQAPAEGQPPSWKSTSAPAAAAPHPAQRASIRAHSPAGRSPGPALPSAPRAPPRSTIRASGVSSFPRVPRMTPPSQKYSGARGSAAVDQGGGKPCPGRALSRPGHTFTPSIRTQPSPAAARSPSTAPSLRTAPCLAHGPRAQYGSVEGAAVSPADAAMKHGALDQRPCGPPGLPAPRIAWGPMREPLAHLDSRPDIAGGHHLHPRRNGAGPPRSPEPPAAQESPASPGRTARRPRSPDRPCSPPYRTSSPRARGRTKVRLGRAAGGNRSLPKS